MQMACESSDHTRDPSPVDPPVSRDSRVRDVGCPSAPCTYRSEQAGSLQPVPDDRDGDRQCVAYRPPADRFLPSEPGCLPSEIGETVTPSAIRRSFSRTRSVFSSREGTTSVHEKQRLLVPLRCPNGHRPARNGVMGGNRWARTGTGPQSRPYPRPGVHNDVGGRGVGKPDVRRTDSRLTITGAAAVAVYA